jgi:hypothetical protein
MNFRFGILRLVVSIVLGVVIGTLVYGLIGGFVYCKLGGNCDVFGGLFWFILNLGGMGLVYLIWSLIEK